MFILDTNILLDSYKNINSINENVLIPITVIKELDNHKTDRNEVGFNARKSIKIIDAALESGKLENGYNLKIDSEEYHYIEKYDDRILASVICNKQYSFITNDLALRIKAKTKGIDAIPFKEVDDNDYFGKVETAYCDGFHIDALNYNGFINSYDIESNSDYENQCYILKDPLNPSVSTLGRKVGKHIVKVDPPKKLFGCINPRNAEQKFYAEMLMNPDIKVILCSGKSGSGKSLIALTAGLQLVNSKSKMNRVMCCKSAVEVGHPIGFLPGPEKEKLQPFYKAFYDNLDYIKHKVDREDYYEKGFTEVEMTHIGSIRGRSIHNTFMIGDEIQNEKNVTVKTIISRMGFNSKIVLCGDLEQIDVKDNSKYDNGLFYAQQKLADNPKVGIISLEKVERGEIAELSTLL